MCIPLKPVKSSGVRVGLQFRDEPTNDLDISTLQILEDYLDRFQGIVIVVSHDRYFMDRVVRRTFSFEEGGVLRQYEGGYTDYMEKRPNMPNLQENISSGEIGKEEVSTGKKQDSKATWGHEKKIKFTYNEQKEYETIEEEIEQLEEKVGQLEAEILKNATDFPKLNALTKEKEEVETLLMEKMERWEYLENLAARIQEQNS